MEAIVFFLAHTLNTSPSLSLPPVMAGVSQLTARDVTEMSVTLVWTPPPIQYETYHITFTSQVKKKDADDQDENGHRVATGSLHHT